jgi:hypothetical protein
MTIAVLQADLVELNAAIAAGVRSTTVGGQTVTFNTTASLIAARNDVQIRLNAELAGAAVVKKNRQHYAYQTGRGFANGR